MIDSKDVNELLNEWKTWRNLDHRMLNDGNPSKLTVSVDLFLMEQRIDDLIRQIKLDNLANNDITKDFGELSDLIRQYQERAYINILRGEH